MNQNSATLQPDLSTSNSPSLPPCVYKCAFMRSRHIFSSLHVPPVSICFPYSLLALEFSGLGAPFPFRLGIYGMYSTGRKQQSNWQGSGMNEHERECHERARARTSTSLHCCVCHASFAVAWGVGSQVWGLSDSTHDMNPKARKQQSTEHERLRRDGSSNRLMCTSTGTHEGFWKRMGVLISPEAQKFYFLKE